MFLAYYASRKSVSGIPPTPTSGGRQVPLFQFKNQDGVPLPLQQFTEDSYTDTAGGKITGLKFTLWTIIST